MRMRSDRWWMLVGALGVTLGSVPARAAGLTGTLVVFNDGPSMDAGMMLPTVQVTWSLQCPGTPSPVYFVDGPKLLRVADGKDFSAATLNLQGDSMPTSGVLNDGEPVGTLIQAVWPAGAISCAPGPGAGNTGGGSNDDIVSNTLIVPPFIHPDLLWGGPSPATVQVGLPLSQTLSSGPSAFDANPADTESVTVNIDGPGISFNQQYSGADWNAGKFLTDFRTTDMTPNAAGAINFVMQYQGVKSNVVAVSVVMLAGACEPCNNDTDCAANVNGQLGCDHGMCNWLSGTGCAVAGLCGGYGCTSADDSCKCPSTPAGTTTKKGKGCDIGADGGRGDGRTGAGVALALLVGVGWWLSRRCQRCSRSSTQRLARK